VLSYKPGYWQIALIAAGVATIVATDALLH
jgi:hypothetical protein